MFQLDLFKTEQECELDSMRKTIEEVRISSDKVRRGMYARLGELTKECYELRERLEIMERNICHGK
jgi:hypothetical protein